MKLVIVDCERFSVHYKLLFVPNNKKENPIDVSEMEGIYSISISNGTIIQTSSNVTDEIKEYALKVSSKNNESGIVGKYIYNKSITVLKTAILLFIFKRI